MPPWAWEGSKVPPSSCLSYGQDFSEKLSSELIQHWECKLLPAYWSCLSTRKHREDYKQVANQVLKLKHFQLLFSEGNSSLLFFWFILRCFAPFFPSTLLFLLTLSCFALLHTEFSSFPLGDSNKRARWLHAAFPECQGKTQTQIYLLLSSKFHSFKSYLSP